MDYKNTRNSTIFLHDLGIEIEPSGIISLSEQQITQSSVTRYLIEKRILVEVNNEDLNVVLPEGTKLVETGFGQVLVPGKFPGAGQLKDVRDVILDGIEKVQTQVQGITEELKKDVEKVNQPVVPTVPEDLKNWFNLRHALKKFEILRCVDPARLKYIRQYDTNEKVQKLIDQRLKELEEETR